MASPIAIPEHLLMSREEVEALMAGGRAERGSMATYLHDFLKRDILADNALSHKTFASKNGKSLVTSLRTARDKDGLKDQIAIKYRDKDPKTNLPLDEPIVLVVNMEKFGAPVTDEN